MEFSILKYKKQPFWNIEYYLIISKSKIAGYNGQGSDYGKLFLFQFQFNISHFQFFNLNFPFSDQKPPYTKT